ncbi:hypothetical protein [Aeoliella mucimassa]|uniref:hypothetical protein n=1 Tax=Aeoliella mucimassa TaxID=2527972 RepID=UPI0018D4A42B|nr:hypothetical protein [Aeoliella mucimassa]
MLIAKGGTFVITYELVRIIAPDAPWILPLFISFVFAFVLGSTIIALGEPGQSKPGDRSKRWIRWGLVAMCLLLTIHLYDQQKWINNFRTSLRAPIASIRIHTDDSDVTWKPLRAEEQLAVNKALQSTHLHDSGKNDVAKQLTIAITTTHGTIRHYEGYLPIRQENDVVIPFQSSFSLGYAIVPGLYELVSTESVPTP